MLQAILIFILTTATLLADVIPNNVNEDTIDSTKVTTMPYGFYKEKMEGGTYKVINKEDMSGYEEKRIFSGYGVYDIEEQNCKYIENSDNKLYFKTDFEKIKVFDNNTFAISRSKMTYPQCVAMTARYVGEVYAPKSAVENNAISRGEYLDDETWIGISKAGCDYEYVNSEGIEQGYSNFKYPANPCAETSLNVYKERGTTLWRRTNKDTTRKCVIRIKTNDYLKPIKICAPWWRVESTFLNKNKETQIWGGKEIDLSNFLMPDVPQRVSICTQRQEPDQNEDPNATKEYQCKKYYSRTAGGGNSGQCMDEPIQPACLVNECAGYIENNCKKKEELEGYKDYTWGYIVKDGVETRVKMNDQIRTYVYECPLNNPYANNCIKREDVVVFPKECPSSRCDELRACIQSKEHTPEYCRETYYCEKVYGDNRFTPVYDGSGNIQALRAKCTMGDNDPSNDTIIENDQIREITYSQTDCVRYELIEEEKTEIKKCLSVKNKVIYSFPASITEPDIYANDPDCVRTNNIEDARPYVDVVFDYINRGFFTTVIQKAYISGEDNSTYHVPDALNMLPYQIPNLKAEVFTSESNATVVTDESVVTQEECNAYFYDDQWIQNRLEPMFADSDIRPQGVIAKSNPLAPYPFLTVVRTSLTCEDAANKMGQTSVLEEIEYEDYPFADLGIISNEDLRTDNIFTRYCTLSDTKLNGDDIIRFIKTDVSAGTVEMSTTSANPVDQQQCEKYVACLGLNMTTNYSGDEAKSCDMDDEDNDPPVDLDPAEPIRTAFVETNGSMATSLDGTKDMIVIEEYAPGRFGYLSNHRLQLPKNNIVKMNGREIFPMIPQSAILEPLDYKWDVYVYKETVKNKDPKQVTPYFEMLAWGSTDPGGNGSMENNYGAAAATGLAVGVGAAVVMAPLAATGVGLLAVAIILMFAGNKRFGYIKTHWFITKTLSAEKAYVANPYGYDFRLYDPATRTYTYEYAKFQSANMEKGDIEKVVRDYAFVKKNALIFSGYSEDLIDSTLLRPCEANFGCIGYPGKVKWYKFSGRKTNTTTDAGEQGIEKQVNTIYMGATNTVTIFVPYKGDYEVVALDANKNILGQHIITEGSFIDAGIDKYPFAKIMFSLSDKFALAAGMKRGTTSDACLYDNFVEWGGGVSGVYYEERTPDGHNCAKSNDAHVQSFSAHYIRFKPVDTNKYFEVKLKKPMPFANRFYLVSLGLLENREYECYQLEGEPCTP